MAEKRTREACGRCSLSTAVDVANAGRDEDGRGARDPYGEERIEVDESELRRVSPAAWHSKISSWIDDAGRRLTWGR